MSEKMQEIARSKLYNDGLVKSGKLKRSSILKTGNYFISLRSADTLFLLNNGYCSKTNKYFFAPFHAIYVQAHKAIVAT